MHTSDTAGPKQNEPAGLMSFDEFVERARAQGIFAPLDAEKTIATLEARLDLVEHALHQTRQRADLVTAAAFDLGMILMPGYYGCEREIDAIEAHLRSDDRAGLWGAMGVVYELLEGDHLEGHAPDGDIPEAEAQLWGARERFARSVQARAEASL